MRKLVLLSACGLLSFAAGAQESRFSVVDAASKTLSPKTVPAAQNAGPQIGLSRFHSTAKATATPFYTETFGSGTRTTLPTGWTASGTGVGSATWHWTNTASTGSYSIGALNSTTASNGWMIYDSDSIGALFSTVSNFSGSLVSPTINCTTHPTVQLIFQEAFRKYVDSCYVDVSNNGGTSWTTFPVTDNNSLSNSSSTPTNPYIVRINISSVAAGQANVKLRFRYVCNVAGGSYNWLVDDVVLSELDPVELGISNSNAFMYLGGSNLYSNYSVFTNYPLQLVDSMFPLTWVSNYGASGATGLVANAKVYNGSNLIYDKNATLATIPSGGKDSLLAWDDVAMFKPTSTGNYTLAVSINPTGDAFAGNNIDTSRFNITDSVLTTYGSTVSGSYYVHRPAPNELSYYEGVRFDIPQGKSDTLTSVSVSYASTTSTGVNTVVQIYKVTGASSSALSWTPVASMRPKTLTAADISTSTSRVFTTYMANTTSGVAPFILTGGTYAAVVTTIGAPSSSTVLITSATPISNHTTPAGYFGQSDTSLNTSNYEFGADPSTGVATGLTSVPLMRINFGNKVTSNPNPGGVANLSGVALGEAYPNPANTSINIPVTASTNATVKVSLYNVVGQSILSKEVKFGANEYKVVSFNTSNLANGTYIYSAEVNGERITNQIVVSH